MTTPHPVRPCERCGQPAELPVWITTLADGTRRDVLVCLDCEAVFWTDRQRFVREGWDREEAGQP